LHINLAKVSNLRKIFLKPVYNHRMDFFASDSLRILHDDILTTQAITPAESTCAKK